MEENGTPLPSAKRRLWYVIYTRPRWEKKVNVLLTQQGIESYCPLRTVKNQWADRQKLVSVPLFTSYVFVFIDLKEELLVRQTLGVINFVYFMGKMATVKETVIEGIRTSLERFPDAEVVDAQSMGVGTRVKIKQGIMEDKEGYVQKLEPKNIIVVIDSLNCVLVTKVPIGHLEVIR